MKRAQVQQVDEFSIQKLRENHETIPQLTSQLEQLQEQMNSMKRSVEFQDIESNYSGRLSHVSSQPEMIPSSRSLLSRDKIAAWCMESIRSTGPRFWKSIFYVWFTSRFSSKKFIRRCAKKSRSRPWRSEGKNKSDKWRRTKLWRNSNSNVCVKTIRWLRVLNIRLIFRRTMWSDSQDSKYRNYNSTGSLLHHHSRCGKQDSKHRSQVVLIFRRKLCYGSKKWRWLLLWMSKNPHDQYMEKIFQILKC